jgi:DNA-binding IclR family transcriptional regulator
MPLAETSRPAGSDSARRILDILFSFTEDSPRRNVKELSNLLDIPVPSMHRYVALLREMGLLADTTKGIYQLTPRVLLLSRAAGRANTILEAAGPHLAALAADLDETVLLVQLIGSNPICVDRYESSRLLRLSFQPGQSLPRLRGASVKVLLGSLPPAEREAYVRRADASEHPPSSGGDWEKELRLAAERGWAVSREEAEEGVWVAAAAITERNRVVGTVTVPCPAFRLTETAQEEILEQVKNTAARISKELDGRASAYQPGG